MTEGEMKELSVLLRKLADALEALWGSDGLSGALGAPKKTKSPPSPRQHASATRFEEFWQAYPPVRKNAKKVCREKWLSKRLDGIADIIIADVKARTRDDAQWQDGFVPAPLTYLNQHRWEDEIITKVIRQQSERPKTQRDWLGWAAANQIEANPGEEMSMFLQRVQRVYAARGNGNEPFI